MKLKVLKYEAEDMRHKCLVEGESFPRYFDVMVDGGFQNVEPEALVGKTLKYRYEHPFIAIAVDVKIIEDL